MRFLAGVLFLCWPTAGLIAQTPAAAPASAPVPNVSTPASAIVSTTAILSDLERLQGAASEAARDIARLRVEKWKADGNSKRQAQSSADSIQRNLSSALPGMLAGVRADPQNLSAIVNLYRNLNALYDVMNSLTESAGAFGPRNDYEALAQQLEVIDLVRRDLGDALQLMTASMQSELEQLRNQVRLLQQAAATAPPPKKVIVDDNEPVHKTTTAHKKKSTAKKPASSGPSTGTGDSGTSAPPQNY